MRAIEQQLSNMFYIYSAGNNILQQFEDINDLENSTINISSFKIDLTKNKIEIPIFIQNNVLRYLNKKFLDNTDYLYYPLTNINTYAETGCKSSAAILKQLWDRHMHSIQSFHLTKATTVNNEVYYGGKGIITYEDFEPMVLFTTVFNYYKDTDNIIEPDEFRCIINPRIYTSDDILSKYIRVKFIQELLATKDWSYYRKRYLSSSASRIINSNLSNVEYFDKFNIVIDDCSRFISTPTGPNINAIGSSDEINKFLNNNIEEIANQSLLIDF